MKASYSRQVSRFHHLTGTILLAEIRRTIQSMEIQGDALQGNGAPANGARGCPLLPSLSEIVLIHIGLSVRKTPRLCCALMWRAEPTNSVHECLFDCNSRKSLESWAQKISEWSSRPRGFFVRDDDSLAGVAESAPVRLFLLGGIL